MSAQPENKEILAEQTQLLKEMLKWLKFMGSGQVTAALNSALTNDKLRQAYQLSDGKNTSTMISKLTGIAQPRISELWKQWAVLGLGDTVTASGGSRFRRAFDLKSMGISVPEIKQQEESSAAIPAPTTGEDQIDKQ